MANEGDVIVEIAGAEAITVTTDTAKAVEVLHDPPGDFVQGTGTIYIQTTPPANPQPNDIWINPSGGGGGGVEVTDHGALTGLSDDDHTQYLNTTRHAAVNHADYIDLNELGDVDTTIPTVADRWQDTIQVGDILFWRGSHIGWGTGSPYAKPYAVNGTDASATMPNPYDGWGTPRPSRYKYPPLLMTDFHCRIYSGTSTIPANSMVAWAGVLQQSAADPAFRTDGLSTLGGCITACVEDFHYQCRDPIKLYRRDTFPLSFPGIASTGVVLPTVDSFYEFVVTVEDPRPDAWVQNEASGSPYFQISGNYLWNGHFATAMTNFKTNVEALGYKCLWFYSAEVIWERRPNRSNTTAGGAGTPTPYRYPYPEDELPGTYGYDWDTNPIPENPSGGTGF